MIPVLNILKKLWSKEFRPYTLSAITLVAGIWIGTFFSKTEFKTVTRTVVDVDTVTVVVESPPEVKYVKVNVPEPYKVIEYVDSCNCDCNSVRMYQADTVITEGLKIGYDATVKGYLLDLNLTYEDDRPETIKYITKKVEVTKENYIAPRGVYLGVLASVPTLGDINSINVTPTVEFLVDKHMISLGYQLGLKTFQVGYKRRIF